MPEAFTIYETLPLTAQQEILDFIYFIAAKAKVAQQEQKEESEISDFDAAFGLWRDRNISLADVRREAWERHA